MADYKSPKGPLRITLSPPDKVTAATVTSAKGADDVIKALGIKVDYAGTRKMAGAAPAPATPPAGEQRPTPPRQRRQAVAASAMPSAKDVGKGDQGLEEDDEDDSTKDVTEAGK